MKLLILLVAVAVSSCGGKAFGPAPAPGTSACDDQPDGTCGLCSDGKWRCAANDGTPVAQCPDGEDSCATTGTSCVSCTSNSSSGLLHICVNGGASMPEEAAIAVSCSQ